MRILFAGHSLARPLGGGEISARTLLRALAATHDVEALCAGREDHAYDVDGVPCHDVAVRMIPTSLPMHLRTLLTERRFRPALAGHISQRPPDLLLLQQPASPEPADVPRETRVVVFLRSLACYAVGDPTPGPMKRAAGRLFREVRWRRNRALLHRADLVISNSQFLQQAVLARTGLRSEVVPPCIDTAAPGSAGPTGTCLTFVGLDPWKGAEVALRLAEALPDRQFLFLEGARAAAGLVARAQRLPNVTCEGWTGDMDAVLARTRVLLMPSLWDEPFGRLPVEAGARGIPTVASARGGLPESVGPGGRLLERGADDVAAWAAVIRSLDDPARYTMLSAAARAHAQTLDARVTLSRLVTLVRRDVGIDLGVE